MLHHNIMKYMK